MLKRLFAPRGVVIVGASQTPTKLGYGAARNLVVSGYAGAIHFVNPRRGRLFGRPIHPDLATVPDPVDLALILIPAAAVPQALEDCGRRGIRAAIVGSGGFRETGPEGRALEAACRAIARRHRMRVLGPNCIGLLDTHLPIDTTFLPLPGPIPGDIAFLSHSGAICEAVIDWARGQGFGLSRLVSLGNQMDLTEADLLGPTAADPHTRVIAMYLEGVGDGQDFVRRARAVSRRTPVVAIKVGRSASGRQAVASHTGALAGRDAAYQAAFEKAGVIRAESSEEMFDWARALAWCPLPAGRRVAVLTNAGGPGAIAADSLEANGLSLAALSEGTRQGLQALLPAAASVHNPVDALASAGPAEFAGCLELLLNDPGVDSVMMILPPPPMSTAAEVVGAVIPMAQGSAKPVVVVLMGEDLIAQAAHLLRQARIPDYRFPERAASALRVLALRAEALHAPEAADRPPRGLRRAAAAARLRRSRPGADGFLDPQTAAALAADYGLRVPAAAQAADAQQAAALAARIGFPVVLKLASADLPHKTESGGVVLGLADAESVRAAAETMLERAQRLHPQARIDGLLVQQQIGPGIEAIAGVVRDEQFGPLAMFGSGGVEVEGLGDVAFALAPLTGVEAEALLERTWAGRRLHGLRGGPPADRSAAAEALRRLAQLASDHPAIAEAEVNPLRVLGQGEGAWALDVRIRVALTP